MTISLFKLLCCLPVICVSLSYWNRKTSLRLITAVEDTGHLTFSAIYYKNKKCFYKALDGGKKQLVIQNMCNSYKFK